MQPNLFRTTCLALLSLFAASVFAENQAIIDFSSPVAESQIKKNGSSGVEYQTVNTATGKALEVICTPGKNGYPGVQIAAPENGVWNLSEYGRLEVDLTNLQKTNIVVSIRMDEAGDWKTAKSNSEQISIPAGKTRTLAVTFGYSWNKPGPTLKTASIKRILIFTSKPRVPTRFRINAVRPAGKPGDKPSGMTQVLKPKNGVIIDFDNYSASAIKDRGTKTTLSKGGAQIVFPEDTNQKWPGAFFGAPKKTIWNLSDYNQVEFTLRNPGTSPVTARCRVDNQGANGSLKCANARAVVRPGEQKTIVVPFVTDEVWNGAKKGTSGFVFDSSKVTGVLVFTTKQAGSGTETLYLEGVKASVAAASKLPEWLGKKPPVAGNWTVTFEDNFSGATLDRTRWVIPDKKQGESQDIHPMEIDGLKSWWGTDTVNSSKNAFVENGLLKIKCEKTADLKEDPLGLKKYKYATSVVRTFGKFSQKYGYFESRMKVPTVLGMWPAFWMMPDRGEKAGIWWKRQSTSDGGMEFDIMEYLGRYGAFRYNIAMHWDGYKKNHKHTGTENIYFSPDPDGFVTSGLLWEPGKATFYCNGRVVGVWEDQRVSNVPSFLMYTMPAGGWGTNGIVDDHKLPAYFEIDYVRVWQKEEWKEN